MKEISELNLPDNITYTNEHEWAKSENGSVVIGITDYAQDQMGDIVFVELPETGESFAKGDEFGTVESVKAVSEIYMPVSGTVVETNAALEENPEYVNNSPYDKGWLIKVKPDDPEEINSLMDKEAYLTMLKG